jgi:LPXTG-motif cell wall-anchored protein
MRHTRGLGIVVAIATSGLMAGFVGAQTTDVKQFEIVSVDGNRVVVRGEQGTEQITITDDVRLTVDGRPIAVTDVKPGMKGTARTTTTTTTAAPVQQSTDVKQGEIVKRLGTSVTARMPEAKTYTDEELAQRNIPVTVDGKPVKMSSLWEGTKLIETTVTTTPERVVTRRQVEMALQAPPAPQVAATPPPAAPPPAAVPAPEPATQVASARQLPTTASPLPMIGLLGVASSAIGLVLTLRRRRRDL